MFRTRLLQRFEDIPNLRRKIDAVSDVINNRPPALRQYDQIYMKVAGIVYQAELIQSFVKDKQTLFMGDGDGMALALAYLSSLNLLCRPSHLTVLDFDERVVTSINRFARKYSLDDFVEAHLYNVMDPVPPEFSAKFDFFYTNPPYGSANKGGSSIVFIDRCLELCISNCTGCVIIPYDEERTWTQVTMHQIQRYVLEFGLVVAEMLCQLHSYHLDDDPELLSSSVILRRLHDHGTRFKNGPIPPSLLANFYGRTPLEIPHYIRVKSDNLGEYYEERFQNGE